MKTAALMALLLGCANLAGAQTALPASSVPAILREIGFDQHPGASVPLNLHFQDEHGVAVTLGTYVDGRRPVVLAPALLEPARGGK